MCLGVKYDSSTFSARTDRFLIRKFLAMHLLNGLQGFLVRRSLAAIGSLAVTVVIVTVVLYQGACANIESAIVQIRQQIEQEIIDKRIVFSSPEERLAYIDSRIQQELANRGLDVCV
jgi:hypothetical protein